MPVSLLLQCQRILPGKIGKIWNMGSKVVCRSILIGNFNNSVSPKLRSIILLHFGPVTFRFTIPKTRQLLTFMILGITGRDHDPQKPLFWILDPQFYSEYFKKRNHLNIYCYWKYGKLGNDTIEKFGKGGCRKIPTIRLISSWKFWYEINIFKRRWKGISDWI